jgi:hypothetical protein
MRKAEWVFLTQSSKKTQRKWKQRSNEARNKEEGFQFGVVRKKETA